MSIEGPINHEPFIEPLDDLRPGAVVHHQELAGTGKWIRVFRNDHFGGELTGHAIEIFKKGKVEFERLRNEYGIHVPDIDLVIGHDKSGDGENLYVVTDEIEGEFLESLEYIDELKSQFDDFFAGILQYYLDRFRASEAFVRDLHLQQLRYGHRKNEQEDHLYLIDVDPIIEPARSTEAPKGYDEMVEAIAILLGSQIEVIERRFKEGAHFEKARAVLAELQTAIQERGQEK